MEEIGTRQQCGMITDEDGPFGACIKVYNHLNLDNTALCKPVMLHWFLKYVLLLNTSRCNRIKSIELFELY